MKNKLCQKMLKKFITFNKKKRFNGNTVTTFKKENNCHINKMF